MPLGSRRWQRTPVRRNLENPRGCPHSCRRAPARVGLQANSGVFQVSARSRALSPSGMPSRPLRAAGASSGPSCQLQGVAMKTAPSTKRRVRATFVAAVVTIGAFAVPLPVRADSVPCFDRPLIAFVSARDGDSDIYTIDGCDVVTRLADAPASGFSVSPAWSPDGTRIAFSRYDP